MPMLVECIDEISRRLGRDILFADLPDILKDSALRTAKGRPISVGEIENRRAAIEFLNQTGISWTQCYSVFSASGWISPPDFGSIFIDIPNDPADSRCRAVCNFFEDTDGRPRFEDYQLFLLPLQLALDTISPGQS